jgi:hypothetical protein
VLRLELKIVELKAKNKLFREALKEIAALEPQMLSQTLALYALEDERNWK